MPTNLQSVLQEGCPEAYVALASSKAKSDAPWQWGWKSLSLAYREALVALAYTVAVASLPLSVTSLLPPWLHVIGLGMSAIGCLGGAVLVVKTVRRQAAAEVALRRELADNLSKAEADRANAESRALRAEEKHQHDEERLATLKDELKGFGDESVRAERLAAGDLAGTCAAEQTWYGGQAAMAWSEMEKHRSSAATLRDNDIPPLLAKATELEGAVKEARSKKARAETERQTVDRRAEKLRKEAEELRKLHRERNDELQSIEAELELLQKSAEEAKQALREETERLLREMNRTAEQGSRSAHWASRQKKTTEADNEILRASLAEKDFEKEELDDKFAYLDRERAEMEEQLAGLRNEINSLEEAARERTRNAKDAARLRERREKVENKREGLKAEVRDARKLVSQAERRAQEADAKAADQFQEAEKRQKSAVEETEAFADKFKNAVDQYNATVDQCRKKNAEICEAKKKIDQLLHRLEASEREKGKLKMELQQLSGECENGDDS